ncbi:putative bifunctional diguanylate cyclase/phosphodiesterase [Solirubrobacter deserti]|uniref:EAL domain-containing protein n=1 Tax=Solirubrobacter deserti TaxID=2282478 RepID=A0ABT4RJH6_9ACTN|nr:EAL domain-containing protein [Solirubrobacter deserti]MDA0138691.1 EAL domain-containing protein [Solirubrobacter deserti]
MRTHAPVEGPALDVMLDQVGEALLVLDREFRCVYLNRSAARRLGRTPAEVLGRDVWELFPEAVGQPAHGAYQRAMREQVPVSFEDYFEPLDGWFETRLQPAPGYLIAIVREVTARKRAELDLARSERRYRVLSHALSSVVWQTDAQGRSMRALAWKQLTGHPVGPDGTPDWGAITHPDDLERLGAAWRRSLATGEELEVTYRIRHADGRWLHLRTHGVPVREDGVVTEWVGVVYDLTEQFVAEDALRRAAAEDPLTGLLNRAVFLERLRIILRGRGRCSAVLYVDVDEFKSINDRFGHATGDLLLQAVGERLRDAVRPSDVVSRLSGDEFAVVCDGLATDDEALTIAARVCAAVEDPLPSDERVHASASIGVTVVGRDKDEEPEHVLRAADAAMYRAKARGGGAVEVFDDALRRRLRQRAVIESELRLGLVEGGLNLHFQPVVALDGARSAAESLLRWQRPGGPAIPAPDAISVAEATGLIAPIGRAVLTMACTECVRWDLDVGVGVNVSARQLARPDELVRDVRAALEASGLPPARLTLEITETVLMDDMLQGEAIVGRLRGLGVRLAIDDFGVGYSSLSYLHRLPVEALKLDRSFIAGLPDDTASVRILEAVVGLAAAFDVRVVAEGVETAAQLAAVREAGCHAAQGYALARPGQAQELPARLEGARAVAAASHGGHDV